MPRLLWLGPLLLSGFAQGHPGSGIVALSASVVLTGDAATNGIWRFERGKAPVKLVERIHCHWMTKGLDGRIYAESLGESGGAWATSVHRLDLKGTRPVAIPSGVQGFYGCFLIGNEGEVVYVDQRKSLVSEEGGKVKPYRAKDIQVGEVFAMSWGPDGSVYLASGASILKVTKDGNLTTLARTVGDVTDPMYVVRGEKSRIWGLAVDHKGNAYATLPAEGRVVKVDAKGKVTTIYRTKDKWAPVGVTTFGSDVFLLESLTLGNNNHGPRVRSIRANGDIEWLGTANAP